MSNSDQSFQLHLRRDNPYDTAVTVRFEVSEGQGLLALRIPGRDEPTPSVQAEEAGIEAADLRAGRFVHVVGGARQSYALSRITPEVIEALPEGSWIQFQAVTEYGFRYLVAPADVPQAGSAGVQLQPVLQSAVSERIGAVANLLKTPQPAGPVNTPPGTPAAAPVRLVPEPSAPAAASSPDSASVAARAVPVAPALAEAALEGLTLDQAREYLLAEMAKVDRLHAHAAQLEQQVAESRAREADLLEILQRWQSR